MPIWFTCEAYLKTGVHIVTQWLLKIYELQVYTWEYLRNLTSSPLHNIGLHAPFIHVSVRETLQNKEQQ